MGSKPKRIIIWLVRDFLKLTLLYILGGKYKEMYMKNWKFIRFVMYSFCFCVALMVFLCFGVWINRLSLYLFYFFNFFFSLEISLWRRNLHHLLPRRTEAASQPGMHVCMNFWRFCNVGVTQCIPSSLNNLSKVFVRLFLFQWNTIPSSHVREDDKYVCSFLIITLLNAFPGLLPSGSARWWWTRGPEYDSHCYWHSVEWSGRPYDLGSFLLAVVIDSACQGDYLLKEGSL